jgi:putative Mg2+ transporter-C (MgtC) family protein
LKECIVIDLPTDVFEFALRPLLAIIFGGVLGWEREASDKPAGLRTMMMVALGSAGFTSVVFWLYQGMSVADGSARLDPLRIIEGVVGGIGFLGAGTIIRSQGSVQGITTAATIWVVGAIGVACGVGQYLIAALLAGYGWIILWLLGRVQHRLGLKEDDAD